MVSNVLKSGNSSEAMFSAGCIVIGLSHWRRCGCTIPELSTGFLRFLPNFELHSHSQGLTTE